MIPLAGAGAAAAAMAWAVRGKSSAVFGPSVWRGPRDLPAIALTFDDGPSPQTPGLLEVLLKYNVTATFFMCGAHVRRLPAVAREVAAAGHEIGNHTDTHARLWLRSPRFIREEIARAQASIAQCTGLPPALFRATYGARWFGLRNVQRELNLLGVMWTVIARDWALPAGPVARRLVEGATNGAIFCLHDGRERIESPDISSTIGGVREAVPRLLEAGYQFRSVSGLIGYSGAVCPKTSSSASSE